MFTAGLARDLVICIVIVTLLALAFDRINSRELRLSQSHTGIARHPASGADDCRAASCRAAFLSVEPR